MSSTFIAYNNSTTGQQVQNYVNDVLSVIAAGQRLMGKLNALSSGSDWTALEANIGGMVPGTGQALWTILSTAQAAIAVGATAELSRLDASV